LGLLKTAFGEDFRLEPFLWLLTRIEPDESRLRLIIEQIDKGINTVSTSSAGRLFDAVAAMTGLGSCNHFDAQLPIALESVAGPDVDDRYEFDSGRPDGEPWQLGLRKIVQGLVEDIRKNEAAAVISAKFHNTLAEALSAIARAAREHAQLNVVALSGGVFCNRYLANHLIERLRRGGFEVLFNRDVPSNDGGIALGQAAIAAHAIRNDS